MAVITGVDFGTLNVRVTLLDSVKGRLGPRLPSTRCIAGQDVTAMALDTTGSSVVVVDDKLQPLDECYLWCDHRAHLEAQEITLKAMP